MQGKRPPPHIEQRVLELAGDINLSTRDIAKQITREGYKLNRSTVSAIKKRSPVKPDFELSEIPSAARSVPEILEARDKKFARVAAHYSAKSMQEVKINLNGPIGIAHFGDPHLDDDGCDIRLFREHMDIVKRTKGLFAGNVGDLTNNWVGRLQHKYADQTTTQEEAWKLVEWMFEYMPWLYVIAGNHDMWSGSGDPVSWISKHLGQPYIPHGVRMRLKFPKGDPLIMHVAHDFPGHSMWNPVHGAVKKSWKFPDDEILVHGHKHHTGYMANAHPASNRLQHLIRCDSYKVFDDYPAQLGIDETFVAPCIVTVINPLTDNPAKRVKVFFDPEEGADYLTYIRKKTKKD